MNKFISNTNEIRSFRDERDYKMEDSDPRKVPGMELFKDNPRRQENDVGNPFDYHTEF